MRRHRVFGVLAVVLLVGIGLWLWGRQTETRLWALDARTGKVAWSAPVHAGRPSTLSAASNGEQVVLWVQGLGKNVTHDELILVAFDAHNGKQLWQFRPRDEVPGVKAEELAPDETKARPLITRDHVYLQVTTKQNNRLVQLNALTGAYRWSAPQLVTRELAVDVALVFGNVVLCVLDGDHAVLQAGDRVALQAFNVQTGARAWRTPLDTTWNGDFMSFQHPLLVAADRMVLFSSYDALFAVDGATGAQQHVVRQMGTVLGVLGTTVFRRDLSTEGLVALNTADLAPRWTYRPTRTSKSLVNMVAVDQTGVYVLHGYVDGTGASVDVVALDPQTGHERWRKRVSANRGDALLQMPQVGNDTVFVIGEQASAPEPTKRMVHALATSDGVERWHFGLYGELKIAASDNTHAFVTDTAPRWRNWLAYLNPQWH